MEVIRFPTKEPVLNQDLSLIEDKYNFGSNLVEVTDEEDVDLAEEIKTNLEQALKESMELRAELMAEE